MNLNGIVSNGNGNGYLIDLRQVETFQTAGGSFTALKGIDLRLRPGEFVAAVGHVGCHRLTERSQLLRAVLSDPKSDRVR